MDNFAKTFLKHLLVIPISRLQRTIFTRPILPVPYAFCYTLAVRLREFGSSVPDANDPTRPSTALVYSCAPIDDAVQ